MFTKKPERDTAGDSSKSLGQRLSGESRPFGERPTPSAKPAASSPAPSTTSSSQSYGGKAVPSIIGEDLTIVGNVTSKGEIQVDGAIEGDVHCVSLLLGEKSRISGAVVADDVVVRGSVTGSISGMRVTLQAQSHVEGDIYHQSLSIEQGAYFEGKSRRSEDPVKDARKGTETAKPASEPQKSTGGFGSSATTSKDKDDSGDDALTLSKEKSSDSSEKKANAAE